MTNLYSSESNILIVNSNPTCAASLLISTSPYFLHFVPSISSVCSAPRHHQFHTSACCPVWRKTLNCKPQRSSLSFHHRLMCLVWLSLLYDSYPLYWLRTKWPEIPAHSLEELATETLARPRVRRYCSNSALTAQTWRHYAFLKHAQYFVPELMFKYSSTIMYSKFLPHIFYT
jgi:hypothetical protein